MAYNEQLAKRARDILKTQKGFSEKKMFGGLCFLLNGNMCCGVEKDNFMVRVGPQQYEKVLSLKYARPMDFTGRPLKGFVYVDAQGVKTKTALRKWIQYGISFAGSLPGK